MLIKAISITLENYLDRNLDMNLMLIEVQSKDEIGQGTEQGYWVRWFMDVAGEQLADD